ncbi:hypothetical protein [Brevundimonas sp.]|uniref:hypothetical protein n=1 Tax=Brevundimonas sp. TaxID=1871086 RepID=UPI002D3671F6|nr:hypothetical protein [Brevundimonas sp.]HYC66666.1 hypothetical protein [Brevundimonas sp.]
MAIDAAITAMRERADVIQIERSRLGSAMRRIHAISGMAGLKACLESELERLQAANDHNRNWIG